MKGHDWPEHAGTRQADGRTQQGHARSGGLTPTAAATLNHVLSSSAAERELSRKYRVFVACPSDVEDWKEVEPIAVRLNRMLEQAGRRVQICVQRWPDAGLAMHSTGPQGLIDEKLRYENSDVFVAIFWRKFGARTINGSAPTEHEVRKAYAAWQESGRPRILLYYRTSGGQPTTEEETHQLLAVNTFKKEFWQYGTSRDYSEVKEFSESLLDQLYDFFIAEPVDSDEGTNRIDTSSIEAGVSKSLGRGTQPRLLRSAGITESLSAVEFDFAARLGPDGQPEEYDVIVFTDPAISITSPRRTNDQSTAYLITSSADPSIERVLTFGRQIAGNALLFEKIHVADPANNHTTDRFRIDNIQVNASQLGTASGAMDQVSVIVLVRERKNGETILTNKFLVGVVHGNSVTCDIELDPRRRQVAWHTLPEVDDTSSTHLDRDKKAIEFECTFHLSFKERMALAFRTKIEEAQGHSGEALDGVTNGTRFLARFGPLPNNIRVFVTQRDCSTSTRAVCSFVRECGPNGEGGELEIIDSSVCYIEKDAKIPLIEVPFSQGIGQIAWEWVEPVQEASNLRSVSFGVVVARRRGASVAPGDIEVAGELGPISTVTSSAEVGRSVQPRFVSVSRRQRAITLRNTVTKLLFPLVTNQPGFDTGIMVSNVSVDPALGPPETGSCTVCFYGLIGDTAFQSSFRSPAVMPGEHFAWSLSSGGAVTATPGFQGYLIVECNFVARGIAYITKKGSPEGGGIYAAEVVGSA